MSSYNLYTGSSDFMDNQGSSITNTGIAFNDGVAKNAGNVSSTGPIDTVSSQLVQVDPGVYNDRYVAGINNAVGPTYWVDSTSTGNITATTGPGKWAGSIEINNDLSHGRVVGDVVKVTDSVNSTYDGVYRVVSVTDSNTYVVNGAYTSSSTGLAVEYAGALTGTGGDEKPVGYLADGRYAIRTVAQPIYNGTENINVLRSPAAEYTRRKVNSRASVRSHLIAEAIRNNYWHPYSGVWTTDPTAQNDFSNFGTDHAVSGVSGALLGEFAYNFGSPTIKQDDYESPY